jgi:PIN domain nuclease of toxin-antitoxin system
VNILLDTHTLVWLDTDASKLSVKAVDYLTDPACRLLLSTASIWELAIKVGTRKLTLSADLAAVVTDQTTRNPIELLPVTAAHALQVRHLPALHKDPFDRMLVAQAIIENATILTIDADLRRYPVRTDW